MPLSIIIGLIIYCLFIASGALFSSDKPIHSKQMAEIIARYKVKDETSIGK